MNFFFEKKNTDFFTYKLRCRVVFSSPPRRYFRDYRIILTKMSQGLKSTTGGDLTKYGLRVLRKNDPDYDKPVNPDQVEFKVNPRDVRDYADKNFYRMTANTTKGSLMEKIAQVVLLHWGFQTTIVGGRHVDLRAALNSPKFDHPCAAGRGVKADVIGYRYDHGGMSCNEDQVGEGKTTIAHLEVKNYPSTFKKGAAQAQKTQTQAADKAAWVRETEAGTSTETVPGGGEVTTKEITGALVSIPEDTPALEPEQFYLSSNFHSDIAVQLDPKSQEAKNQMVEDILKPS